MEQILKLANDLQKRIETLDDRMEYYDDIRNALERSKVHLKMSLEALASANSYPVHFCIRKKQTYELYGQLYNVDYNLYKFEDASKYVEFNFVYDAITGNEEKHFSKHMEEKLKQLILK